MLSGGEMKFNELNQRYLCTKKFFHQCYWGKQSFLLSSNWAIGIKHLQNVTVITSSNYYLWGKPQEMLWKQSISGSVIWKRNNLLPTGESFPMQMNNCKRGHHWCPQWPKINYFHFSISPPPRKITYLNFQQCCQLSCHDEVTPLPFSCTCAHTQLPIPGKVNECSDTLC